MDSNKKDEVLQLMSRIMVCVRAYAIVVVFSLTAYAHYSARDLRRTRNAVLAWATQYKVMAEVGFSRRLSDSWLQVMMQPLVLIHLRLKARILPISGPSTCLRKHPMDNNMGLQVLIVGILKRR